MKLVRVTLFALLTLRLSCAEPLPNDFRISGWWSPSKTPAHPEVHADRTITFRVTAPRASRVELLFGEWDVKPQAMAKGGNGEWSLTIGPVEPETYCYEFSIDGVMALDLGNPAVKSGTQLYGSVVEVPGKPPRFDEVQDVPHGVTEVTRYFSTQLRKPRSLYVYLPPGYDALKAPDLPVLYLRHGGGDDESSWTNNGHAGVILENLMASGKAVPMLIVMPNGLTEGSWASGSTPEALAALERELLVDVIPLVEKRFRVSKACNRRAIAGLSMGGGQSFVMGLRNLDTFSWIGEFSAGLLSAADFNVDKELPGILADSASINRRVRLLWLGCGNLDPRFNGHLNLADSLKKRGINHKFQESSGGHEWKVWRHQLEGFLPLLFRD